MEVISFGYGHGEPPAAHIAVDVRAHFRDAHVSPALRYLAGADVRVREAVMSTPVGCTGGRHRSVVIAAEVACRLGPAASLTHRDISLPVIDR